MNKLLLELTASMPMKQINLERVMDGQPPTYEIEVFSKPYIQRYYAGTFRDGVDLWLHRFLSNDGDRHLHSHPFEFKSVILNGGYKEEFLTEDGKKVVRSHDSHGHINEILPDFLSDLSSGQIFAPFSFAFLAASRKYSTVGVFDWHRIAEVQTETWSAVLVEKRRLPKWYFKGDDGDLIDMIGSPRDWHKNYGVRPECGISNGDNKKS